MSIIAETLNRLQTDYSETQPGKAEEVSVGQNNQEKEARQHLQSSETILGRIALTITLGLAGLSLLIFVGEDYLHFSFSTNSHSSPTSPLTTTPESTTDTHVKTEVATAPTPIPTSPSTSFPNKESISSVPITATTQSPITPPGPNGSSSTQLSTEIPPPPLPNESRNFAQATLVTKEKSWKSDPNPVSPKATTASLSSTKQQTEKEHQDVSTQKISQQKFKKPKAAHPVVLALKDTNIPVKKLHKTRQTRTQSTKTMSGLSTLQTKSDSTSSVIPTAVPVQTVSTNLLHQGQHFIRIGKYNEAVTLLSPLFHDPPNNWQPWFWMGTALLGKGEIDQADQYLLSGLARNDKIPQLWIQRALVAQQRGDYQLAIHELRQAESLEANLPHIPLNMGYAYERLGNNRLANQYYGKFLELSEDNPKFFSIRKKLFARLTQKTQTTSPILPSAMTTSKP